MKYSPETFVIPEVDVHIQVWALSLSLRTDFEGIAVWGTTQHKDFDEENRVQTVIQLVTLYADVLYCQP